LSQPAEKVAVQLFQKFIAEDKELIQKIGEFGGSFVIGKGCWTFSLPDLFSFLSEQNPSPKQTDYSQFRSAIYQSAINHQLSRFNAVVEIAGSTGKVDHNLYCIRTKEW